MSLREWLGQFKAQHEQARAGRLSPEGWAAYRAGRDELARALLAAQRASLRAGEVPRQALRVARAATHSKRMDTATQAALQAIVEAGRAALDAFRHLERKIEERA